MQLPNVGTRTHSFDTVVLFDVENLLGHPKGWKEAATELSFGDILAQLRLDESGLTGRFAVSRAYANWSLQARRGAEAARRQDFSALKEACAGCHDAYRTAFRAQMRDRRLF